MARFIVLGAKGGTGREIAQCLAALPTTVVREIRCVVRDPSSVPQGALPLADKRLVLAAGDVTRPETLGMEGKGHDDVADGVFFAASGKGYHAALAVDEVGVGAVATAAAAAGVRRVLLVSSQLVHPTNRWSPIRMLLNSLTGLFAKRGLMDFKWAGEQLLRASGVPYTIVRPGRLIDGVGHAAEPRVGQCNGSFMRGAPTTRADVAVVCVAAVLAGKAGALNTTFEMACDAPHDEETAARLCDERGGKVLAPEFFAELDATWDDNL